MNREIGLVGELSAARQALESAELAPGNLNILRALTNPERRPSRPGEVPPPELLNRIPDVAFQLDEERFAKNVRSARRGAAPGPSGMTSEHLCPMLENDGDLQNSRAWWLEETSHPKQWKFSDWAG